MPTCSGTIWFGKVIQREQAGGLVHGGGGAGGFHVVLLAWARVPAPLIPQSASQSSKPTPPPLTMKSFSMITLLGLAIAYVSVADAKHSLRRLGATYTSSDDYQAAMLASVNSQRAAQGLSALCTNSKLQSAAQGHSDDQAKNNYMSHTGADGSTMSERITASGFDWSSDAENVAAGQEDVDAVMTAWMNSPGHRANILGDYKFFGTGYAYSADSTYGHYWTQDFGTSDTETCDSSSSTSQTSQTSYSDSSASTTPTPTTTAPAATTATPVATTATPVATTATPVATTATPVATTAAPATSYSDEVQGDADTEADTTTSESASEEDESSHTDCKPKY